MYEQMYIVKKKDPWGNFVDMFHAHHGYIAFNFYKLLEKREGKNNVIIVQK
jgi:hypothetical protein